VEKTNKTQRPKNHRAALFKNWVLLTLVTGGVGSHRCFSTNIFLYLRNGAR